MAFFSFLIRITYTAKVYFPYSVLYKPIYGLSDIVFLKIPKTCKIIDYTIGDNSENNLVPNFFFLLHKTVYRIIKRRVSTYNDNCLITVMYQHARQTLNAVGIFALNKIIKHSTLIKSPAHFFPLFVLSVYTFFGTIKYSPS